MGSLRGRPFDSAKVYSIRYWVLLGSVKFDFFVGVDPVDAGLSL